MCKFNGSWRFLRWIIQVVGEPASPYNKSFYTKNIMKKTASLNCVIFSISYSFLKMFQSPRVLVNGRKTFLPL